MTNEERLARLEKDLARGRRLNRWLLAALGVSFGAWVLAGTLGRTTIGAEGSPPALKEIRAGKFILEDEKGRPRATLRMYSGAGPGLELLDENGKMHVSLCTYQDLSALELVGADGKTDVSLFAHQGLPQLGLSDRNGRLRAYVGINKDGPSFGLCDENGRTRATMGTGSTQAPDGTRTISPESSLHLFSAEGKVIWQAP